MMPNVCDDHDTQSEFFKTLQAEFNFKEINVCVCGVKITPKSRKKFENLIFMQLMLIPELCKASILI